MNDPQSIIVYRSKSQQMLDQMIWNGDGSLFPIMIGMVAFVAAVFSVFRLQETFFRYRRSNPAIGKIYSALNYTPVIWIVSVGVAVIYYKIINYLIMAI